MLATLTSTILAFTASAHATAVPVAPFNAFTANTPASTDINTPPADSVEIDSSNDARMNFNPLADGGIDFETWDASLTHNGQLILFPMVGASLTTGTLTVVPYGGIPNATNATAQLNVDQMEYNGGGTVDITELVRDGGGAITSFAADYSIVSVAAIPTSARITGQIRYNSQQGFVGRRTDQASVTGTGSVGSYGPAQTITLTAAGSIGLQLGAMSMSGPDPDDFAVLPGGTCLRQTLDYGQTCTIIVRAQPGQAGTLTAVLHIADNTTAGSLDLPLSMIASMPGAGTFHPLKPTRILDTRPNGALRPAAVRDLAVLGHGGVPRNGVSAVVLNLTVASSTASGYLTAYPRGQARPTASNINFPAHWTGANMVTVSPGTGGVVDIFNAGGTTNVVVDVLGFYAADETLTPALGVGGNFRVSTPASRVLDTRTWGYGAVPADYYITLAPDYGATADPHITAFAINVTAVNPSSTGYLSVWPGNTPAPTASTLNFTAHHTVPNMAIVPTSECFTCGRATQSFSVLNASGGPVHLLVDVVGFFDDGTYGGTRFHALSPTRILDTRVHKGAAPLGPAAGAETVTVTPSSAIAVDDTWALVQNVTAVKPTASTYLTLWPALPGVARPATSNVNATAGQTVANAAITEVGSGNAFHVFNSKGRVDVLADVAGRFDIFPSYSFGTPSLPSVAQSRSVPAAVTAQATQRPVDSIGAFAAPPAPVP